MQSLAEWGPSGNRAQAGPLSYVLVFAMIIAGATVVLAGGGMALTDAQDQAELQRAEHTMTLFDSRAAMVALGESETQTVSFGQDSGILETRPDAGYLAIKHADWNDSKPPEVLFKRSLGAVVYENGDHELAYQGGGVWRLGPEGKAQIISPPEFHYRGATLTLPVVRVDGSASGSGSVNAQISGEGNARKVYPNASATYPSPASSREYLNPIRNGSVAVYVKSDYYEGWATYFRQRTEGEVTVFHNNKTVRVKLKSIGGAPGAFDMPGEGKSLDVSGFGSDHPIDQFTVTLQGDNKEFNNGHWSLYSTQGGDEFEMHIYFDGKCKNNPDEYDGTVNFGIYYYNTSTDTPHEWQNPGINPGSTSAFDFDCSDTTVEVNLASIDTNLTYGEMTLTGSNNKWCFGEHIKDRDVPPEAAATEHDVPYEDSTFEEDSGNATMKFLVNHYMERMGFDYDLTVKDGPGNSECLTNGNGDGSSRIVEGSSFGTLEYEEASGAQFITYLHVTDNEINVSVGN